MTRNPISSVLWMALVGVLSLGIVAPHTSAQHSSLEAAVRRAQDDVRERESLKAENLDEILQIIKHLDDRIRDARVRGRAVGQLENERREWQREYSQRLIEHDRAIRELRAIVSRLQSDLSASRIAEQNRRQQEASEAARRRNQEMAEINRQTQDNIRKGTQDFIDGMNSVRRNSGSVPDTRPRDRDPDRLYNEYPSVDTQPYIPPSGTSPVTQQPPPRTVMVRNPLTGLLEEFTESELNGVRGRSGFNTRTQFNPITGQLESVYDESTFMTEDQLREARRKFAAEELISPEEEQRWREKRNLDRPIAGTRGGSTEQLTQDINRMFDSISSKSPERAEPANGGAADVKRVSEMFDRLGSPSSSPAAPSSAPQPAAPASPVEQKATELFGRVSTASPSRQSIPPASPLGQASAQPPASALKPAAPASPVEQKATELFGRVSTASPSLPATPPASPVAQASAQPAAKSGGLSVVAAGSIGGFGGSTDGSMIVDPIRARREITDNSATYEVSTGPTTIASTHTDTTTSGSVAGTLGKSVDAGAVKGSVGAELKLEMKTEHSKNNPKILDGSITAIELTGTATPVAELEVAPSGETGPKVGFSFRVWMVEFFKWRKEFSRNPYMDTSSLRQADEVSEKIDK